MTNKEESELEATIQEEAEQYIPFDINEVNLDFDILASGGRIEEKLREGRRGRSGSDGSDAGGRQKGYH